MTKIFVLILTSIFSFTYIFPIIIQHQTPQQKAMELTNLIIADDCQQRSVLTHNEKLAIIATRYAEELAQEGGGISHTDSRGWNANKRVKKWGYNHPYRDGANNLESLHAGAKQADEALWYLLMSPPHKKHICGDGGFFSRQTEIGVGVGYNRKSKYKWYYVILISHPED